MSKLISCKSCGEQIAKGAKSCPHCGAKNKKPFYKKWWFLLIVIIFAIGIIPTENNDTSDDSHDPSEQIQENQPNENSDALTFELVAGELGEYGEMFTINKGTEFEESYYIYRIPEGTYTVTNTGSYMSQLNVYSDEIKVNENGWEEPADCYYVKLFDVGSFDTVSVPKGYYIHIDEPSKFKFE